MKTKSKNCAFTICAKNYLARAICLKKSFLKHNNDADFYIFIADRIDQAAINEDVVTLNDKWCPHWLEMSFKYNVIEFSTSIKPFCFEKLFNAGYTKVLYLDPDTYVLNSLEKVYETLSNKSLIITPHYNIIQTQYTGAVTEEELLFVGIYNLGFAGIKNDNIGNKVIQWWENRLENKCYADHIDSLHVDQRWFDFVPAFFPENVEISHDYGLNAAIWNLHERDLYIDDDGEYSVISRNGDKNKLVLFHFSGFDPQNPKIINRRHPKYNINTYPSYKPLISEYVKEIYENSFDYYSTLTYSFNKFNDFEILPIHRRLFRQWLADSKKSDIDEENITAFLKEIGSLAIKKTNSNNKQAVQTTNKSRFYSLARASMRIFNKILGTRRYSSLLINLGIITRFENQDFLYKKK